MRRGILQAGLAVGVVDGLGVVEGLGVVDAGAVW